MDLIINIIIIIQLFRYFYFNLLIMLYTFFFIFIIHCLDNCQISLRLIDIYMDYIATYFFGY